MDAPAEEVACGGFAVVIHAPTASKHDAYQYMGAQTLRIPNGSTSKLSQIDDMSGPPISMQSIAYSLGQSLAVLHIVRGLKAFAKGENMPTRTSGSDPAKNGSAQRVTLA